MRRASITERPQSHEVPVLCKLWFQDGVWNGSAHDLPIAVFGKTIDEARKNLGAALVSHFHALQEIGKTAEVIRELCRVAGERLSFDEMANNELYWKVMVSAEQAGEVAL